MPKILVLYYSAYGHIEKMAEAVAEGVRSVPGMEVTIKRVPELVPEEVAKKAGMKLNQAAPIATVDEMASYDAIIFGTLTGSLVGKVGSVFAGTATQHGGQETTITSFHTTLLHQGMIIVGLPYAFLGLNNMDEITGGTPYGATTLTKGDGSRQPSANELDGARYQGRHVAQITAKLTQSH